MLRKVFTFFAVCAVAVSLGACKEKIIPTPDPVIPKTTGFYDLETAYFNGWLSVTDLKNIAYYYNGESDDLGFVPTPEEPDSLDYATIREMKIFFYNWLVSAFDYGDLVLDLELISLRAYFGTYDGCIIATFGYGYGYNFIEPPLPIKDCLVGGVLFKQLTVFSGVCILDGEPEPVLPQTTGIYNLETAYLSGWLSVDDLKNIAYYYNFGESDDPNFTPAPIEPAELDDVTIMKIKELWIHRNPHNFQPEVLDIEKLEISRYYGVYGGNIVCRVYQSNTGFDIISFQKEIGGVLFKNYWTFNVQLYILEEECGEEILPPERYPEQPRVAGFYDLETAYFNGWLSVTDLKNIAYYYHGGKSDDPDFVPAPKEPAELDAETIVKIKTAHFERLSSEFDFGSFEVEFDLDKIFIVSYYGTYSGCVIVFLRDYYVIIDPPLLFDKYIGGVLFENYWALEIVWL